MIIKCIKVASRGSSVPTTRSPRKSARNAPHCIWERLQDWVPEGSLARFFRGAFLRSGRPRGPGKPFKNVGGFVPHLFESSPGPRSRPDLKNAPRKIRPDFLQVPRYIGKGYKNKNHETGRKNNENQTENRGEKANFGRSFRRGADTPTTRHTKWSRNGLDTAANF